MKIKFLLRLIGDVIINGNKHLCTFENPVIHYPIFHVKKKKIDGNFFIQSKFNNVLKKRGQEIILTKTMNFD
jgi:hypothetical protein